MFVLVTSILLFFAVLTIQANEETHDDVILYKEIAEMIEMKGQELNQHPLIQFIKDDSLPVHRRLSFAPYLCYVPMSFADILDTWLYKPNPQNKLEEYINQHIQEDNFHYNFYLHDIENVLGLSLDDFGSYSAIMRHLWGDDSRAIRHYIYGWLDCVSRYRDPILTITSLEALEAGSRALIGATSELSMKHRLDDLLYLGRHHMNLEMNHSQVGKVEGNSSPLEHIVMSEVQMKQANEITDEIFTLTYRMFDALHALALADNSIRPDKYIVEGNPTIKSFPLHHPNRRYPVKDEL